MFNAILKIKTNENEMFEFTMQDKGYVDNLLKRIGISNNSDGRHIKFHHSNGLTLIPVNVVKHSIIEVSYSTTKNDEE